MYLAENHLEKAKEIALNNRKKRTCKKCYDRGYIGLTPENTLVICEKCVNVDAAMEEWKEYVKQDPADGRFKDLFGKKKQKAMKALSINRRTNV